MPNSDPQRDPQRHDYPEVVRLLGPPGGGEPDRVLRVRFGRFVENLLASGIEAPLDEAGEAELEGRISRLGAGADILHDVLSGGPPLDGPLDPPYDLASYFLSLGEEDIDASHDIVGFDADYHFDEDGARFSRLMRLTDYLDSEGHTFAAHLTAVLDTQPVEDPRPGRHKPLPAPDRLELDQRPNVA